MAEGTERKPSEYERYIRTEELLSLQKIAAERGAPGAWHPGPLFPPLWEAVNELTREWRPEY
jgi:hypothetical protein